MSQPGTNLSVGRLVFDGLRQGCAPASERRRMSRLVVVSNRVATNEGAASGGLAVALRSGLSGEPALWFGWSGERIARHTGLLTERRVKHRGGCAASGDALRHRKWACHQPLRLSRVVT